MFVQALTNKIMSFYRVEKYPHIYGIWFVTNVLNAAGGR
jgi:hypothetical protein